MFGISSAVFIFIIAVILEARIMRRCFPNLSLKKCGIYSVTVNMVSLTLNLPLVYLASISTSTYHTASDRVFALLLFIAYATLFPMFKFDYAKWMAFAFVLMIIYEFSCLAYLLKHQPLTHILRFAILSNIVSIILVLLSFLPWMVVSFFLA
jgi:hypothetical protein